MSDMDAGTHVVELAGLTKRFGQTQALDDVHLQISAGEIFGYLGPNGAGKTTTIRLLMGLLQPTRGTAMVLGHDSWRDAAAVHRLCGYVPGEPALYAKLTGLEHVEYLSALRHVPCQAAAADLAKRFDLDLTRPARVLSKGNRQKLAIVLALMHTPRLLVLDEPTTGLDPFAQEEFLTLIRDHAAAGGTVLLSSHVLAEVQRTASRVGIVRAGRLIAVERLDQLRAKSMHHVTARLAAPVDPREFSAIDGVRSVEVDRDVLRLRAPQDALDRVVKTLAAHELVDLECAEADLEETFRTFYGVTDDDAARHQP